MTAQTRNVLEQALALPEAERVALVASLLESLPDDVDEVTDQEFVEELDRRFEEYERDPTSAVPWEQIKRKT